MRAGRLFRVAIVVWLTLSGVLALPAQEQKPLIAVLPFKAIEVSASTAQIIATLFETNLVNTDAYTVLSQNERQQILAAQEESVSECTDEACAVEIGKLLAAEQIIIGTVAALGKKLIINAKVIDVQTSKTLAAGNQSADSVEELDLACDKLTTLLVQKAMPKAAVAAKPAAEPAAKPAPAAEAPKTTQAPTAAEPAKTAPAAEAAKAAEPAKPPVEAAKAPEQPAKPAPPPAPALRVRPEATPSGLNVVGLVLTSAGNALTQVGWYARSMSFAAERRAEVAWHDYVVAGDNLGQLYSDYDTLHRTYAASSAVAYSLWAVGPTAFATPVFLFPNRPMALSTLGRITLAASMASSFCGNLAQVASTTIAQTMDAAWATYSAASAELAWLYGAYEHAYGQYRFSAIVSYSLWALSAAAVPAAYFMPGVRTATATGLASKLMVAAGSLAVSMGGYAFGMAQTRRALALEAWRLYERADENLTELYSAYDSLHRGYVAGTVGAVGLWAAGGAAVAAALFLPDRGPADADVTIGVSGSAEGLTVAVAGRL